MVISAFPTVYARSPLTRPVVVMGTYRQVIGSDPLERQIRELGSDVHIFGHTHIPIDMTSDGVRYVQWPLGERAAGSFSKPFPPPLPLLHLPWRRPPAGVCWEGGLCLAWRIQ